MTTYEKFWIVMRDAKKMYASRRHATLASAQSEASRLATAEGARFFVLGVEWDDVPVPPPDATAAGAQIESPEAAS